MNLTALWQALETSAIGDFIATSGWAFPAIESLHVIAIVTVVGCIAVMDLRLLGFASGNRAVSAVSQDTLKWTWLAFGLAVVTGLLLFVSRASSYAINPYFLWKMGLLALAGLNMAIFHLSTWRTVENWDANPAIPRAAKFAGGVSLALWIGVVFCGRVIGFTLGIYV